MALASVLLNCSKHTFEESKRELPSHSVPFTYSWVTDQYSTCTKQCGGGTQTRSLSCIRSTDNATVSNAHCSASTKPQTERACNTQVCPTYNWKPNSYSSCTKQCGGGTQTRSLSCIRSTDNATVSNAHCSASTKPQTERACNTQVCPTYNWKPNSYSSCTKQCGGGTQTRSLSCIRSTDNATVSNAHCSASTKPQTERACNTQVCPTYNWKPNSYFSCTKQCGGGTQTRSLSCIRSTDNATVANRHCSASTKPQTERACNTQACPTYNWKPNSYFSCTKQCGGGIQTRSLSCIRSTDNATVANRHCSASTKPQTERACNTQACPTYNWKPNSYSSCTKQCGGGTQTRSLSCIRSTDNATVANARCSASTKPQIERACNTNACPPTYNWKPNSYSSCTKQCGGGTQTRSLSCIRSTDNATVPNAHCSASAKPQIERACNTNACPPTYNWKPSSYSSCTKQCGGGTQTRSLSCIRSTDNATVANTRCSASTKPQTERTCNTNACPPTYNWKPSSYSSCTKQCGGGTQTRSLSCIRSTDNATVANTRCSASTKPQTERTCNTNACPPTYNWKPSSYSSCTKQCGGGTQTRSLSCIRSTDNATVANTRCSASTKPQIERACNTNACPPPPIVEEPVPPPIVEESTPFRSTWRVPVSDKTITLPLVALYNYNFTVDWGDGSPISEITAHNDPDRKHTYARAGDYNLVIEGLLEAWSFNNAGDKDKILSVEDFGDLGYKSLSGAFQGCTNLAAFEGGVTSSVTDMGGMFSHATSANPDVRDWDVSNVTYMNGMFHGATSANPDVRNWDVSNVTNMRSMFSGATSANPDVRDWDVSNVTYMNGMFHGATSANPDVRNWDVSNVTHMGAMFRGATRANPDVSNWDVSNVTGMWSMFSSATSANPDVSRWDVSSVTDMSYMFFTATSANPDVSRWDVSNVIDMGWMFSRVTSANLDVRDWDVSNVTDMGWMFFDATSANPDVSKWDVSNVTDMDEMFYDATSANPDVSKWDVSNVTDMDGMFNGATSANPDVRDWDVSNVTDMGGMFSGATSANPDVSKWDVSSVTDMRHMFSGATSANPDVSRWDVSNVIDMGWMFSRVTSANPDVRNWDVSSVTDMAYMFSRATSANPDVSKWNFSSVTSMLDMFNNSGFTTANYDALLIKLAGTSLRNVELGVSPIKYSSDAAKTARDTLQDRGWTIRDGGDATP